MLFRFTFLMLRILQVWNVRSYYVPSGCTEKLPAAFSLSHTANVASCQGARGLKGACFDMASSQATTV